MIRAAEASNKKDAKLAALKLIEDCPESKNLVYSALDPFTRFGVKKIDMPAAYASSDASVGQFISLMNDLTSRRLTGNAARSSVTHVLGQYTEEAAGFLARVLKKDLDCGIQVSTANDVYASWIHEPPYMRCALAAKAKFSTWDWAQGAFSQEKADGRFTNADHTEDGEVRLSSRQGHELPLDALGDIVATIQALLPRGTQSHGEFVVYVDGKPLERSVSNGVMNRIAKGGTFEPGEVPVLLLWDQIPLNCAVPGGVCEVPYHERIGALAHQLTGQGEGVVRMIPTRRVYSLKDAYQHSVELMLGGKEGTVLKERNGIWKDSGDSGVIWQIKLKLEADVDLKITGFRPGDGKNTATFGSVIMQTSDGLLEVGVSGMKQKIRDELWERREELLAAGAVATIRGNAVVKPSASNEKHSIFLPRWVELRLGEKSLADTLQQVIDQFEAAIKGA